MSDMFNVTLDDQIECLNREHRMRREVYPRLIRKGRMTQKKSDWELACIECAIATLMKMKVLGKEAEEKVAGEYAVEIRAMKKVNEDCLAELSREAQDMGLYDNPELMKKGRKSK